MRKEHRYHNNQEGEKGVALVSAILSITLLVVMASGIVGVVYVASFGTVRFGGHTRAVMLAKEGLEAVRSIRDDNYDAISPGVYGVATSTGRWQLVGSATEVNGFTREIEVTEAGSGTSTRDVSVTVSWSDISGAGQSVALESRLTNWQAPIESQTGGGGGPGGGGPPGQQ